MDETPLAQIASSRDISSLMERDSMKGIKGWLLVYLICLLYTSDAADEL